MTNPVLLAPIGALPSVSQPILAGRLDAFLPAVPSAQGPDSTGFSGMVSQGLQKVNDRLIGSEVDLQRLAAGDVSSLNQIMVRLEESRLSFQLMLQVRNRLLESYQDLMRMQV